MPLDLPQVWEGGSRDDREPGDRPLTRIQLVRRRVDGRGVMGLLKYAAGSAAIVALACCHSAARAQSKPDQLPPVEVNPTEFAEAGPPNSSRSRSPCGGPGTAGRKRPHLSPPTADGGGGNGRQGARAHQPHGQLDQRGQRRDASDQQSRFAGRRIENRSRPRHHPKAVDRVRPRTSGCAAPIRARHW